VSRRDLDLSAGPCGLSSSAVHCTLARTASSSRELSASSRVLRPATCPPCLEKSCDQTRPTSASRGVLSLIAASTSGVHHCTGNPDPALKFPPRRFSRPRGFAPPPAFAGLFHPAATSRVCPSGDLCLTAEPYRVSPAESCPRAVERISLQFDPRQPLRPRLQGLAPRAECGCRPKLFRPRPIRAPHGLHLPRVFPPRNVQMPSHPLRPRP
jgi:hypothetical protein